MGHRYAFAFAATLLVAATAATAQVSPKEVSRLDVATYKDAVMVGCRAQGRGRGDPGDQVQRRCNCVLKTLNSRLTEDEWKRATFFAQQRKEQDEAQVLERHLGALKACGGPARK